jgi:DNA (cytosine-5)-methyltransferase 1
MAVYYNDSDPAASSWLRELISTGLLPEGEVDARSILEVAPADLRDFTQCHFFAGIGGWPHALRLAGLPEDRPVWTGSPPCQPFSMAGQRKGEDDDRHLAPAFLHLVFACRPGLVFGEQVASAAVLGPAGGAARRAAESSAGRAWFDALATELEAASYAVAAADLPAAGFEGSGNGPVDRFPRERAPHIRQRLFFGAVALDTAEGRLADTDDTRPQGRFGMPGRADQRSARPAGLAGRLAGGVGRGASPAGAVATDGVWDDPDWLLCRDDRWRPVEPGAFPLADGIPGRVGLLRGYGNAIVPPLAAAFVTAFLDCTPGIAAWRRAA